MGNEYMAVHLTMLATLACVRDFSKSNIFKWKEKMTKVNN